MIIINAISNIWNNVWPYLVAILCFMVLIVIHEFGHFIAAKSLGVRVNEFSVGFGPKLFSKKWGETEYKFCLIPFGGYCAMEGEDETSSDEKAYCNKKPWRRFIICAMGAIFNLLLGLIIIAIILAPVKMFATTEIGAFDENAVSCNYGLQINDKIVNVDGRHIFGNKDLAYAFTNIEGDKVDMTVVRDGKKVELDNVKFKNDSLDGINYLKVDFSVYGEKKTFSSYIKNTFKTAVSNCAVIWRSLVDLVSGKYGISAMSGPVGVATVMGDAAKANMRTLLDIMALISINLGIFNLLPLPALDGGRLLFILIEMIFRKPIPQKYEAWVHAAGFVILIGFMLLVTAGDIMKLVKG